MIHVDPHTEPSFDDADEASDWEREMLRELARMGMTIARAIEQRVVAAAAEGRADDAGVLAFTRVAKTVRMALALNQSWTQAARVAEAAEAASPAAMARTREQTEATHLRVKRRMWELFGQDRVREVIEDAIERDYEPGDAARLRAELREYLLKAEDFTEISCLAIGMAVDRISLALGVKLDWSRWINQQWATDYASWRCKSKDPPEHLNGLAAVSAEARRYWAASP